VHIEEEKCIVQSLILRHAAYLYEALAKEAVKKTNVQQHQTTKKISRKRSH